MPFILVITSICHFLVRLIIYYAIRYYINEYYCLFPGKLVESCNENCLFSAEYHSGQLALRDIQGNYLSPVGSKAILKSRSNSVTKDELFSLEDSLPQASFVAALNSRFVSVKQGKFNIIFYIILLSLLFFHIIVDIYNLADIVKTISRTASANGSIFIVLPSTANLVVNAKIFSDSEAFVVRRLFVRC